MAWRARAGILVAVAAALAGCSGPSGPAGEAAVSAPATSAAPDAVSHEIGWAGGLPARQWICTPVECVRTEHGDAWQEHALSQQGVRRWSVELEATWQPPEPGMEAVVEVFARVAQGDGFKIVAGGVLRAEGPTPLPVAGDVDLDGVEADTLTVRIAWAETEEPVMDHDVVPYRLQGTMVAHV